MPMKPGDLALHELDLNLIPYLVGIKETRNVSRAAERLGVSQPRVSTVLGHLREYFSAPLFVRTSRGMEPTPRALALVPVTREALNRIERGLLDTQHFDPAVTTDTFAIALSDVGEIVFLPSLLQTLASVAPQANLRSVSPKHDQVERALWKAVTSIWPLAIFPISPATISSSSGSFRIASSA